MGASQHGQSASQAGFSVSLSREHEAASGRGDSPHAAVSPIINSSQIKTRSDIIFDAFAGSGTDQCVSDLVWTSRPMGVSLAFFSVPRIPYYWARETSLFYAFAWSLCWQAGVSLASQAWTQPVCLSVLTPAGGHAGRHGPASSMPLLMGRTVLIHHVYQARSSLPFFSVLTSCTGGPPAAAAARPVPVSSPVDCFLTPPSMPLSLIRLCATSPTSIDSLDLLCLCLIQECLESLS